MRKITIISIATLLAGLLIFLPLYLMIEPQQLIVKQFINGTTFCGFIYFYRLLLKFDTAKENTIFISNPDDLKNLLKKEFVLYLRPFIIDDNNQSYGITLTNPLLWFNTKLYTIEEQIVTPFQNYGLDVISISSPKDSSFYLGTKKIKIGYGIDWKKIVELFLDKAKYICLNSVVEKEIFHIDKFNGFDWEVKYCLNNPTLRTKMIILCPGKEKEFINFINQIIIWKLENLVIDSSNMNKEEYGGLIYFKDTKPFFHQFSKSKSNSLYIWGGLKTFLDKHIINIIVQRAPLLKTIYANLIDVVLLLFCFYFIDLIVNIFQLSLDTSNTLIFIYIGIIIFLFIYSISIGKKILKISIRDISGIPAQSTQLFNRQCIKFFSSLFYFITLPITIVISYKQKKWIWLHDYLTNTDKFLEKSN